ncbi:MAG TPA: hypothetical protein VN643_27635 [Pyrinomonadaceae bacterium]|nr:hypothetical protein [Pyrinomonadaceae bacterium]
MANTRTKTLDDHADWEFRREALVWQGTTPIAPNLFPLATDLRNWMLRNNLSGLSFLSTEDKQQSPTYTNPYLYDGSILSLAYAQIINDSSAFTKAKDEGEVDWNEIETRRIRLYAENVLYTARLCEAFIKQLLYCTTFDEGDYEKAALGTLLSKDCRPCRAAKKPPHRTSLLGSLAHRYRLCHSIDSCLEEHMRIVTRRRNLEAAHAGFVKFSVEQAPNARSRADSDLIAIGNDFIHMLAHLGDLETKMISELETRIRFAAKTVRLVVKKRPS